MNRSHLPTLLCAAAALVFVSIPVRSAPIHDAAKEGNTSAVARILKDHPTLINERNAQGVTPLHFAVGGGHITTVEYLLEQGADIESLSDYAGGALHIAAATGGEVITKLLLDKGANVDAQDRNEGWTPLHHALFHRHMAIATMLLERKARIDLKGHKGTYAIHVAAETGSIEGIRLLLDHGADPNAVNDVGRTPLHCAARIGSLEIVRTLLGRGARNELRTTDGESALDYAVQNEHHSVAEFLRNLQVRE